MNMACASKKIVLVVAVAAMMAQISSAAEGKGGDKYRRSKLTHDKTEGVADRRKLLLTTGEDKVVDLDFEIQGEKHIAIGNPQIVAFQIINVGGQRKQVVFKPLKAGETTVTVRNEEGTISVIFNVRVTGSNLLRVAGEIRDLLKDVEGIDIRVVGQKVVVDGEVLVPYDYGRLLSVITDKSYVDTVLNLTTMSQLALVALARKIQEDVNAFAPNVKTRVVNGMIFLEGTTESYDQAKRAYEVAKLYLPEVRPGNQLVSKDAGAQAVQRALVQNHIVINEPPKKKQEKLVRITVHFVELAKDYNKMFGFKWQPGFTSDPQITIGQTMSGETGATTTTQGGVTTTSTPPTGVSFSATISSLIPRLMSAQNSGFARILKTGTVIGRDRQPVELNEQTEFPFVMMDKNGQPTSSSKSVGLSIAVTPAIVGQSEDIQLDVDLNQVNLTGRAPAAGAPPIVANHRVKSKLYVKNNESAALAAVTSSDIGTDFNKDDPQSGSFDGNTKPLFSLLRSKAYRKKKSQFVIFITPQIIENPSEGTEDLKKNFKVKVK